AADPAGHERVRRVLRRRTTPPPPPGWAGRAHRPGPPPAGHPGPPWPGREGGARRGRRLSPGGPPGPAHAPGRPPPHTLPRPRHYLPQRPGRDDVEPRG